MNEKLRIIGENADEAKYELQNMSTEDKNKVLEAVAADLVMNADGIIEKNSIDYENGKSKGMSDGLLDRLLLTVDRIKAMSEGLIEVIALEDPTNKVLDKTIRSNGLIIKKVSVPLGVIGMIYESRPNVTCDAFGLCFKAGNAVILKGGSDAINSNIAITNSIRGTLKKLNLNENFIQLIEDTSRETTAEFMKMKDYIDVLIPRGGAGLIAAVVSNSTVPVIETGTGNCHVYVDKSANFEMATNIIINAKTQRTGVCNACESLVIHKDIASEYLPIIVDALKAKNVMIYADDMTCKIVDVLMATEEDYGKEYLDLIISIKVVDSIENAIRHINKYNTKHSDVIVTDDKEEAMKFLNGVDSACVYWNASSRFSDGFEFGLGAEIGISTQKIHARGPMGLKEITSYKYVIEGEGQTR